MIRVGFVFNFSDQGWLGGINYFQNLFNALYSLEDRRIEPVIFAPEDADIELLKGLPQAEVIDFNIKGALHTVKNACMRIITNKTALERALVKNRVAVLSHSLMGIRTCIPALGWIPDFQHLHLPEFFSPEEIDEREKNYRAICDNSTGVIVSSFSAQNDLKGFAPGCVSRSRVLQFVAGVPAEGELPELEDLEGRYGFKGPYIYLPNQFWAHKNHKVVLEALKTLKESGKNMKVIATGNTHDYRQPGHLKSLMDYVEANGLSESFKVLGLVPRKDVFGLMRHSIAVLNPSFFEGWSTTVEEAKSMGKRIILSDIPVHREQDPPGGVFFNPKDPEGLAEKMLKIWSSRDPFEDERLMKNASAGLLKRRRDFAKRYEEIILGFTA